MSVGVSSSINASDPINWPSAPRDRIREEFFAEALVPATALLEVSLLPQPILSLARHCPLRLHRRNYSRVAARVVSSRDSASANISGCVAR
jgi:hypothetical protein